MVFTSDQKKVILLFAIGLILLAASIYPIIQGNSDMEKYRNSPEDDICYREEHHGVYPYPCSKEVNDAIGMLSAGLTLLSVGGICILVAFCARGSMRTSREEG